MATPENGIIILHLVDGQSEYRKNGKTPTVVIYEDGTAREGQDVPPGTPCRWTGFDKTIGETGEIYGKPIKVDES